MMSNAVLSDDLVYRYRLERQWEGSPTTVTWVMLNPSTADAHVDDPTVNRCISFTRRAGYGRLLIVNLFALRATDPTALALHPDPVGPRNLVHVSAALGEAQLIVAAWGAEPMALRSSVRLKLGTMAPAGVDVVCLGKTGKGHPKHPGRLAAATLFLPFDLP
jgi:hypothetical protein